MLSEYQRAVLTELGVVCWQSQDAVKENRLSIDPQSTQNTIHSAKATKELNQTKALEQLSQLKRTQERVSYQDQILCTFDVTQKLPDIVFDILAALEVENLPKLQLNNEQLKLAKDFRLCWCVNSDAVELSDRTLQTPPFEQLKNVKLKKHLWLLIQKTKSIES
jgi:hypothetical protein